MTEKISNIIFTRNRPLQFEAYLESLYRHMGRDNFKTYVLYKKELFDEQYREVFDKFGDLEVIEEEDFRKDFSQVTAGLESEYVNFGTDDVVYFDGVDFSLIEKCFEKFSEDILAFTLRLSKENIADNEVEGPFDVDGQKVYRVNWTTSRSKNAYYPFELNSTFYKRKFIQELTGYISEYHPVLAKIFPENAWWVKFIDKVISMKHFLIWIHSYYNPNILESNGYRYCKRRKRRLGNYLYFQKICSAAVQINTVRPGSEESLIKSTSGNTIEDINEKFKQGYRFDHEFYESNPPSNTHAEDEHFRLIQRDVKG